MPTESCISGIGALNSNYMYPVAAQSTTVTAVLRLISHINAPKTAFIASPVVSRAVTYRPIVSYLMFLIHVGPILLLEYDQVCAGKSYCLLTSCPTSIELFLRW